jgi:hypothetical protein
MDKVERWFPIRFDLAEQDNYRSLKHTERVVLTDLYFTLSEHLSLAEKGFRSGPFGRPDYLGAGRLHMSLRCYRGARAKLRELGWVDYSSGHWAEHGERRPTSFYGARYSRPKPGVRCAIIYRAVWQRLITALYHGLLKHQDVSAFVWLCYLWELTGAARTGSLSLPAAHAKSLTGMPARAFAAALRRLQAWEPSTLRFDLRTGAGRIEVLNLGFLAENATESPAPELSSASVTVATESCNPL